MALLLMSPTHEELSALFPESDPLSTEHFIPSPAPHKLFHPGKEIYLCLTGLGPINAALATGYAVQTLVGQGIHLDHVLLIGLAGAFDLAKTPLRSLCVVTTEIWPEYGLNDGHAVIAEAFKWPMWQDKDSKVIDRVSLADLSFFQLSAKHAKDFLPVSAVSVAGVSASLDRTRQLWDQYHAELENMEGFAVAYCCARLGLTVTEIRVVSNKTGPRRADEKDFPGAHKALGQILSLLNLSF